MDSNWFEDLFIDEAKAAMMARENYGGSGEETQTYILVDDDGTEYPAVLVSEETIFTATANDIREGMVAATGEGVVTGTKEIPAYITTEGTKVIRAGSPLIIDPGDEKYKYTKLLAVVCSFNTSLSNSVAVKKTCINGHLYLAASTEILATITIDDNAKTINLGVINDESKPVVIRYITYKEEL